MKYSINSSGYIVAERDIYSLGGFIPKGSVGAKVANEDQISQDGECWVAGGNISARPDVRIKDNAYVGNWFASSTALHTDVITELSGNTLIPGTFVSRSPAADIRNNFFAKDSFIGVSLDVLCGPSTTATAFPFEQGGYLSTAPRGTAFSSSAIQSPDVNICRGTGAVIMCGNNTRVYLPTGYSGRVLWAYTQNGTAVYSGESVVLPSGLSSISHPVYKQFMLHVNKINGTAMTPADLLATGAKILGHISGSVTIDIRPESVSGDYVMNNSSLIMNTNNFGLVTVQLRRLAGSMYDTTMYTKTDRSDYKLYGTFRNVERLEYTKYLPDSHRTAATRDTYISAYDCPLLRVDEYTYVTSLESTGNLVLRRCIVPKAEFQNDVINGNTYEDIDFSYTNEDLGYVMTGYTRFLSSHKQGIYRMSGGPSSTGFVSHKGNLADTARLMQAGVYIPLDGNIMEQGSYQLGPGASYEDRKEGSDIRVRTATPIRTEGLVSPSLPGGYVIKAILYLDDSFIVRNNTTDTAVIDTEYPYCVMSFRKDDNSAIKVTDFIALNGTMWIVDQAKAPEITGSAYVGAGCTVRGDVKLIGDPYVNRVFDVNMWERGENTMVTGQTWAEGKNLTNQERHFEFKEAIPVEAGGTLSVGSGYFIYAGWLDENKRIIATSGVWAASFTVPANVKYVGLVLKKAASAATAGTFIEDSDIPLANVKYLRTFEKRRYITNELDRTSPKDVLLGPDMWEQGYLQGGDTYAGKIYEELKSSSLNSIRIKRPVNASTSPVSSLTSGFLRNVRSLDASTKLLSSEALATYKEALSGIRVQKDPSAAITPSEIPNSRLVLEFVPSPRIVVPYGSSTLFISGPKIRMYDNAVLSRNLNQEGEIVLSGEAVMGYDFNSGDCMCSNGHSDAIIKLP